jgi:hypothetical protein
MPSLRELGVHASAVSPYRVAVRSLSSLSLTTLSRFHLRSPLLPLRCMQINLYVSLEELYSGASKSQKVVRSRLGMDGRTLQLEEKIFVIQVCAGWRELTRITFAKEGDESSQPLSEAGDIVFLLRAKPHPRFTRRGNDIVFTARLTLLQALTGATLAIETLDRRIIPIGLSEIATPGGSKLVVGEGLPHPKTGVKGNLVIEFDIAFPQQLTTEQKNELKRIMPATA